MALVFGFFALDEMFQAHERVGKFITNTFIGPPHFFRSWNDIIVIGYGVAGIIAVIFFLPEILKYPRFAKILLAAFLFYCLHTFIDSTIEPKTTLSVVIEESAKLLCVMCLALSSLAEWLRLKNS